MYIGYIPVINLLNASSKEKIKDNLFGFAFLVLGKATHNEAYS